MEVKVKLLKKKEQDALNELSKTKGMSPECVLRQAFRVYQTLEKKVELGLINQEDVNKLLGSSDPGLCLAHEGE